MTSLDTNVVVGHTPGPWTPEVSLSGSFVIESRIGAVLCQRTSWESNAEESRANGYLMAAAPDLKAALKAAHGHITDTARRMAANGVPPHYDMLNALCEQITDAIAKAEGWFAMTSTANTPGARDGYSELNPPTSNEPEIGHPDDGEDGLPAYRWPSDTASGQSPGNPMTLSTPNTHDTQGEGTEMEVCPQCHSAPKKPVQRIGLDGMPWQVTCSCGCSACYAESKQQAVDAWNSLALRTAKPADGWQLVPVEPTEEMINAAFDVYEINVLGSTFSTGREVRKAIYHAMLASAPKDTSHE